MQFLTSTSKYLTLVLLICSLLVVWDGGNTDIISVDSINANSSMQVQSAGSIWLSLGNAFKLDHRTQSSQVQAEIRKLLADHDEFYKSLRSAAPYIYYIYKQTKGRGLPAELALIPLIESEFNPNDHSNKGATGLWQLMPGTAQELGVKVRDGYDGRRNVIDSTKAALAYFKDLGQNFNGNWYLAIAAYNCGQGCIASAQRRTGTTSFWNLPLPRETRMYVPKLLAVAEIVTNPEKYGIELPPITNQPYFSEVVVNKPVSLTTVASASGINIQTLKKLNPDYKNQIVVKKGVSKLLVPVSKEPVVKANFGKV